MVLLFTHTVGNLTLFTLLISNPYFIQVTPSPCGWFLLYDLGGYRNCANVGRWHKSNNVKFVVDLKVNKMCQACHDPDCKDFRYCNRQKANKGRLFLGLFDVS